MRRLAPLTRFGSALSLVLLLCGVSRAIDPTIEELKARFTAASIAERPHLCLQIAQMQASEADRLYAANDFDKAKATLVEVVTYAELARDYSIQSHKYQKQTEIAVRGFARKLGDMVRTLPKDDQGPVHEAIGRLQRVRDDLLSAMFPKGAK